MGSSGNQVNRLLMNIGTARGGVRLLNAVMRFDNVGTPTDQEIKAGQLELYRDLHSMPNLNVVTPMGQAALLALSNFWLGDIGNRRGSILTSFTGLKMVPTYHPSFYMHGQWHLKDVVEFDLKRAFEESKSPEISLPQRTHFIEPTFGQALEWLESLLGAEWISFDVESLPPFFKYLSCMAFSDHPSRAYCIPFVRRGRQPYWSAWEEAQLWRRIQTVLAQPKTRYVTQYGLTDCWKLYRQGITVPFMFRGWDTMYAHRLIAPDLPHALEFLSSIYTREPYYKDESGSWEPGVTVPIQQYWTYNCKDAAVTLEVCWEQIKDLRDMGLYDYFMGHMMPQFPVLLDMKVRGIKVDREKLAAIRLRLESEIKLHYEKINRLAGWMPNTKSYLDMEKLFNQYGVSFKRTETGRPKIDEDSLILYASQSPNVREVLMECLEVTSRRTLHSGFTNIVLDQWSHYHPFYDLSHAVTGRQSSEGAEAE